MVFRVVGLVIELLLRLKDLSSQVFLALVPVVIKLVKKETLSLISCLMEALFLKVSELTLKEEA